MKLCVGIKGGTQTITIITNSVHCTYLCSSGSVLYPLSHFVHFTSEFSVGSEIVSMASRTKRNRRHNSFDEMPPLWDLLWKQYNRVHIMKHLNTVILKVAYLNVKLKKLTN